MPTVGSITWRLKCLANAKQARRVRNQKGALCLSPFLFMPLFVYEGE